MKAAGRIPVGFRGDGRESEQGPSAPFAVLTTHGGPRAVDSFVCPHPYGGRGLVRYPTTGIPIGGKKHGWEKRVLRRVVAANGLRPALIFFGCDGEQRLKRFHLRAGVGGRKVMGDGGSKPHKSRAWIFHLIGGVFVGGRYFSALSFQTAALAQKRGHLVYSGLWLSLFPQPVAGDEFAHGRRNRQNAPGGRRRPGR